MDSAALGLVEEPLAIFAPVVNEGVWQWTQPIFAKVARPFSLDGVAGAGVGGASIRMKLANASMSEMTAVFELPVAGVGVKLSVSSGVALKRQPGVSSRSCGKQLVRDSHLDVVCLTREHEKGFVLCLPPETRNGPIVCTAVHISA